MENAIQQNPTFSLPADVLERLQNVSKSTGKTMEQITLLAILRHLEDLEDIADAEEQLKQIQEGKVSLISSDEMVARLGLEI